MIHIITEGLTGSCSAILSKKPIGYMTKLNEKDSHFRELHGSYII